MADPTWTPGARIGAGVNVSGLRARLGRVACVLLVVGACGGGSASAAVLPAPAGVAVQVSANETGQVCVGIHEQRFGSVFGCYDAPGGPDSGAPIVPVAAGRTIVGAVPAAAARVEVLDRRAAHPLTATTQAAGDPALAGVRFFVVRLAASADVELSSVNAPRALAEPFAIRALDRTGDVVALQDDAAQRPVSAGPVEVLQDRSTRGRFVVTANRSSALAGVPGDAERREPRICLRLQGDRRTEALPSVQVGGAPVGTPPLSGCLDPARVRAAPLLLAGCARGGVRAVAEALQPGERRARLILATGERERVRVAPLPMVLGAPIRIALAVASGRIGLRRVEFLDAAGAVVRTEPLGLGPLQPDDCGTVADPPAARPLQPGEGPPLGPPGVPAATAGADRLFAADAVDGRLCVAVDRPALTAADCDAPQHAAQGTDVRDTGGVVGGSVPADVRAVSVLLSDGSIAPVTLQTGDYLGRWANGRRFYVLRPPVGQVALALLRTEAPGFTQLAAALLDEDAAPLTGTVERLGRLSPHVTAYGGRVAVLDLRDGNHPRARLQRELCVAPRTPATNAGCTPVTGEDDDPLSAQIHATVDCVDRRFVAQAPVSANERLQALTANGLHVGGRSFQIFDRRVGVVAVPPRETVTSLEVERPGAHALQSPRLHLASGQRQCGYSLDTFADAPGVP